MFYEVASKRKTEAAKQRRRRSSVPGVKRPAMPSRLAPSVPGRVLGDEDGTRSENLSRATCSRSMTNLPDACQTFAVRYIPSCRAKISIQNVLIKFKGRRSFVRATLRYHGAESQNSNAISSCYRLIPSLTSSVFILTNMK